MFTFRCAEVGFYRLDKTHRSASLLKTNEKPMNLHSLCARCVANGCLVSRGWFRNSVFEFRSLRSVMARCLARTPRDEVLGVQRSV